MTNNMNLIENSILELDKNKIIKDVYAQQYSGKNKVIYIYIRNKYDNYLGQEQVVITYHSKNDRLRISPFKSVYYDNKKDCLFTFVYENKNIIKNIIKNYITNNPKSLYIFTDIGKKTIDELTLKALQKLDRSYNCEKIEGNMKTDSFFDCFELLHIYNTFKKEGSYQVELKGHSIEIKLKTGLYKIEVKNYKYYITNGNINDSFDDIHQLIKYIINH